MSHKEAFKKLLPVIVTGTAVVTMDAALLWTDGRYYVQAVTQMDSDWILMKEGQWSVVSGGEGGMYVFVKWAWQCVSRSICDAAPGMVHRAAYFSQLDNRPPDNRPPDISPALLICTICAYDACKQFR